MENFELIKYVLLSLFLVFLFGKALGNIIENFTSGFRKNSGSQKNKIDLDTLIRQKEQILRTQEGLVGPPAHARNENHRKKSPTLKAYQLSFKEASANNNKSTIEDLTKSLELFDNLQWGDGPIFNTLSKKIKETYAITIDPTIILNHFKIIFEKGILISNDKTYLYNEIKETIIFTTLLHQLYRESQQQVGDLLNKLSSTASTTTKCYALAFEVFILRDMKSSDQEIFENLSINHDFSLLKRINSKEIEKSLNHFIFNKKKKELEKSKSFFTKIGMEAQLISSIIPFKDLDNFSTLNDALEIFSLPKESTIDEVKKRYKQLALLRHPDKLAGKKIPEELKKQAHKNFTILQKAYDIIKSEI